MRTDPPANPRPELSARKSPMAVPNVFEKRIAIQYKNSTLNVSILSTESEKPL
jgi:hypothetical protein